MEYNEDGICRVNYTDGFDSDLHFYVAYRFMNRARLRLLTEEEFIEIMMIYKKVIDRHCNEIEILSDE